MDDSSDTARPAHRDAVAAIDQVTMLGLTSTTDGHAALRLGVHLSMIGLLGWAVATSDGIVQLAFQAALGVPLVFLFCAQHESIHRTAFRTPRINDLLAAVIGFVILVPSREFRYFHFAHHRFTQDPAHDPELQGPSARTRAGYLLHLSGWFYWRAKIASYRALAFGGPRPAYVPARAEARVRTEARAHLAALALILIVSAAGGSTAALTFWLLPMVLGQPWLRAYLMAEHTACPLVPDMLANTRTVLTHRLIRWLAWEMPWHTAHHLVPTVPFHRLRALTALIEERLSAVSDGYPAAHREIVRTLA